MSYFLTGQQIQEKRSEIQQVLQILPLPEIRRKIRILRSDQEGRKGQETPEHPPFHSFFPSFLLQPGSVDNIQGNVCLHL